MKMGETMIDMSLKSNGMIDSRTGELLSNGARVYHAIIDCPTSKDMGHPVGLAPQVQRSISAPVAAGGVSWGVDGHAPVA